MLSLITRRLFARVTIVTPTMAESITEGVLSSWDKRVGDFVRRDEQVASIETDKITLPVNAPESGVLEKVLVEQGDTVTVGSDLFILETDAVDNKSEPKQEQERTQEPEPPKQEQPPPTKKAPEPQPKPTHIQEPRDISPTLTSRSESRRKMTPIRLRIAQRLKESQNVAASLTTFNEIDMSALMNFRAEFKEEVQKRHNIKLGFMGAFVLASSKVLREIPMINSRIEDKEIIEPNYVDISVAVSTPKGLVTPVLRNSDRMSLVEIETTLFQLAEKAKNNQITQPDLEGGTFTISNGGVFGSMSGTPIINTPQSAILGMHAIKDRAVVVDGQIAIRPMMNVALTYDHRIVDGKEAVTFLVRLKQLLEDPRRLLLDI